MGERCPHIISKCIADESWDWCELSERPSGRIGLCIGDDCTIYKEIKEDWEKENK